MSNIGANKSPKSNLWSSNSILDLDENCCECVMEWLPLADIRSLRSTCKPLKRIADHHIESTYPNGFGIFEVNAENYKHVPSLDSCISTCYKHILYNYPLFVDVLDGVAPILNGFEKVTFSIVTLQKDFYGSFNRMQCSTISSTIVFIIL